MKTPNEVHAFLALKYGRNYITKLAAKLGRPKFEISKTVNCRQKNIEIRKEIAADSGMTLNDFFEPEFDSFFEARRAS